MVAVASCFAQMLALIDRADFARAVRQHAAERAAKVFAVYGTLPSYRAMLDKEGAAGPADIAITGSVAEVQDRVAALASIGVTDFAAVEFGATPDEIGNTREALKGLLR